MNDILKGATKIGGNVYLLEATINTLAVEKCNLEKKKKQIEDEIVVKQIMIDNLKEVLSKFNQKKDI